MKGLIIKNLTHWCDRWSADLAANLHILDASYDVLIFDERHSEEEIMAHLQEAPPELYHLIEVVPAPEDCCDLMADSGLCYRRVP